MEPNRKVVEDLLAEYELEATEAAKNGLVEFAMLYAEKLVRGCLARRSGSKKITVQDVRRNYEMLHKIHSSEYEEELNERKKATINKATKSVNLQDYPAKNVVTLNLYSGELQHMLTGKECQLAFE